MKIINFICTAIAFVILIQGLNKLQSQSQNSQLSNLPTCNVKPGSVYDGDTLRYIDSTK